MKPGIVIVALALASAALSGCTAAGSSLEEAASAAPSSQPAAGNDGLNGMISSYAAAYDVPETLVHHVVKRESNYNPGAYNAGNWGLMQIRYPTAKGMGYRGDAKGLLDAETNLKYAVKYLRGAYVTARGDEKEADWLYRTGYYYAAKRRGLLDEAGLTRSGTAADMAVASIDSSEEEPAQVAAVADEPAAKQAQGAPAQAQTQPTTAQAQSDPVTTASVAEDDATDADSEGGAAPEAAMAFAGPTPTSAPSDIPIPSFRPKR